MSDLPPGIASPTLSRSLGTTTAIAMVVGSVIGSGIFLKPGVIAGAGGQFPLIITAWIVGGVVCLFGGLCMAELALMMPKAGGHYVYVREAYGRPAAFLSGWNDTLLVQPAANGALAFACIGALARMGGYTISVWPTALAAILIIVILTSLNVVGVAWGGLVQTLTTFIKGGFLVIFALLPIIMFFIGSGDSASLENLASRDLPDDMSLTKRLTVVFLAIMWAYSGWHYVTPVAEEIKNPEKNITRALIWGILILLALYVAFTVAMHVILPMSEIAGDIADKTRLPQHAPQRAIERLFESQGPALSALAGRVLSAVVMISTFSAINAGLLVVPRVTFAMARDRVFFPGLGHIHPRFNTPSRSILLQGIAAITVLLLVAVGVSTLSRLEKVDPFELLTNYSVFTNVVFTVLAVSAVMVLRVRQPNRERPYRVPGYPLVPILFLVFNLWFIYQVFANQEQDALIGGGMIMLAIPVYYLMRRRWL